ncbi:MAG: DegT/DnrJ/EryC1/StrS family aminotransferase, partial [Anaerolineae bacterium]|nr:DegT/DnrJ/EryC1/StrS family aminotransferase [Anaerolineae bacterium]
HIGYNLKATDMQAAVGVAQLQKLPGFIEARRKNFAFLHTALQDLQDVFILPEATPGSQPSWFGFPIALRDEAAITREDIVRFLNARKISTRQLFGGNLLRQPAYQHIEYRRIGPLINSDRVMNQVFWIGVYPGLTEPMLEYMADSLHAAVGRR